MRPTASEQIMGLSRILTEVIAPEITSAYPAEILRGAIGALNVLGASLTEVPAFLAWDIEATSKVLEAALPLLSAPLAGEVRETFADPVDPTGWAALEERQQLVRGQLVRAMPAILASPSKSDAHRLMIALYRERATRFPFQMSARPAKKP